MKKPLKEVLEAALHSLVQADPDSPKHELERLQSLRARVEDARLIDGGHAGNPEARERLTDVLNAFERLFREGYRVTRTGKHHERFEQLSRAIRRL